MCWEVDLCNWIFFSFQAAIRLSRSGKKILYLAAKAPESLPIEEYDDALCRDILKNIVFTYCSRAPDLIAFFMEMQLIQPKPDVVIVDFLHTFFDDITSLDADIQLQNNFIECHMVITAGLHAVLDMLSEDSATKYMSIICIDPQYHGIYQRFIQTYVDLYYYKDGCIFSLRDLAARFT